MIRTLLAAAIVTSAPFTALAQDGMAPDLAERTAAARQAEATARIMTQVQQASAIAQRQFAGMRGDAFDDSYRGAVAFPADTPDVWNVVIAAARGQGAQAPLVALAEYEIAQGQILSETLHNGENAPALSGTALQMARAKYVAPRAVIASASASYCLDGELADADSSHSVTYIPLVLPPDDTGALTAYVLNGPIAEGAVPLGKHYRVTFDEFGQIGDPEIVTDTCEVVTWDTQDPDIATQVYVTGDTQGVAPTAIHSFISSQLPMRIGVVTGDIVWPMADGMIAPPVPAAQTGS
ncbi:MAG: hypothetical protein WA957_03060 [Alteraurantiacibacter sp.]